MKLDLEGIGNWWECDMSPNIGNPVVIRIGCTIAGCFKF